MESNQFDLFETHEARTVFDQLLAQTRTYAEGRSFRELLDFTARMPQFAPFNAMLLHIQRPGLTFATSGQEWLTQFGRYPKADARPLLILWPFSPVAFIYDILDTDGRELPEAIYTFYARGNIGSGSVSMIVGTLQSKGIRVQSIEAGDAVAGSIEQHPVPGKAGVFSYSLRLNSKHPPAIQFVTLAHELGHLFLGHLGLDAARRIPDRCRVSHEGQEIEAELVAYFVARRTGIEASSEGYLSEFLTESREVPPFELFHILRAAGHVEASLGLSQKIDFGIKRTKS